MLIIYFTEHHRKKTTRRAEPTRDLLHRYSELVIIYSVELVLLGHGSTSAKASKVAPKLLLSISIIVIIYLRKYSTQEKTSHVQGGSDLR